MCCDDPLNPHAKLVIEVDGNQHGEPFHQKNDAIRDANLRAEGFSVYRVWNNEVDQNMEGVMAQLDEILAQVPPSGKRAPLVRTPSTPFGGTSPIKGEDKNRE